MTTTGLFFRISIHFLGDEFHGRSDGDAPEWPPSPLRLFQALVAVSARLTEPVNDALHWLEKQPPPVIVASRPAAIQPRGYKTYVPNNEGDVVARSWVAGRDNDIARYRAEKLIRPIHLEEESAAHYCWQIDGGAEAAIQAHIPAIRTAVRAISQFGWGIDLVVADASVIHENEAAALVGERWLPGESMGGVTLRVPVPGSLADLRKRHQAFLDRISLDNKAVFKPVPPLSQFRLVTYRRESAMARPPYAVFALRKLDDSGFAAFDPVRRSLHLAGMLRHAASRSDFAAALGWGDKKVASFVLGHNEKKGDDHTPIAGLRLVFIPLPSIEWRGEQKGKTVGSIRRVLVTVRGEIGNEEFARIVGNFEGRELMDEQSGRSVAFLRRQSAHDGAIEKYFAESRQWATVTPIILPGYDDPGKLRQCLSVDTITPDKKKDILGTLDKRIDSLLRKALRQAGFPEELARRANLQWRGAGFMPGADLACNYAVPDQHRRFRRLHVRIVLDRPISGPVCIGGGRFTGLGLFAAVI